MGRQVPHIVVVLHAAVRQAELHHRLELLRESDLRWVPAQPDRREVQQCRQLDCLGRRHDGFSEGKVHLERDAGAIERGGNSDSHSAVDVLLANVLGREGVQIEQEAIVWVGGHRRDLTERGNGVPRRHASNAE